MCGIVGYAGKKGALKFLINGLKRLEYRGYDSAGIAVLQQDSVAVTKKPGKLHVLTDELKRMPLEGSTGIGHCLSPDTIVYLADGSLLPISKIKDGQHVFSFNLRTHRLEPASAKVTTHKSPPYLYNLRTPFASLTCTAQHRMFTFSEGEIVEKKVDDIKKGDFLVVPKNILTKEQKIRFKPIFVKRYFKTTPQANRLIKTRLKELQLSKAACAFSAGISEAYIDHIFVNDRNFREDKLNRLLPFLSIEFTPDRFMPQNTIHGKFISLPNRSSVELMQILGYLLGDGTVKKRCLRFKDLDKGILQTYRDLIKEVFNIHGRVVAMKGTRAWLLEVNSFYLCQWLKKNVISRQEDFLSELGRLPSDEIAAFLRGIFDAEGSVNLKSGQVSLRITNKHLVKISQFLLLRCEIFSSFYTENKKIKNWNSSYGVFLNNLYSFEKFLSTVGFSSKRKLEKLKTLILKRKPSSKYKDFQKLSIAHQPILEIKKIKSEEELLFDLEINHPDSNFIANGLLSHNSRWATHGIPNEVNAHPHLDSSGKIAVVHNGIIENHQALKCQLKKEGYKFISDTDTEVIPNLIAKYYKGDLLEAVRRAVNLLKGSYAICCLHDSQPNKVVGTRRDSPLIIGVGEGENFFASDVPAILDYTKNVVFLENLEVAEISPDAVKIMDQNGKEITKKISHIKWNIKQAEKSGFRHFMLKEIFEQQDVVASILKERVKKGKVLFEELALEDKVFKKIKNIAIIACGTAYHASLAGKYMLEKLARIPIWVDTSSEFRYRNPLVGKDSLVILVSQSGETADTLAAMREAKKRGAKTLAICNVLSSSIARESDGVIYTHAGPEIAVASTKAYTAQLAILYLFTIFIGRIRNTITSKASSKLIGEFKKVPRLMQDILERFRGDKNKIADYAKYFRKYYLKQQHKSTFLYLARNINYPNALEGALKLKEISYISAEGYPAGEMKHGPIALIDENPWVVCIATQSAVYDKMLANIQEIKARGGIVIAVTTKGDKEIASQNINYIIEIPEIDEFFSPMLVAIPLQLLAYYVAREFGYDIDQPRNLAKSVTVE